MLKVSTFAAKSKLGYTAIPLFGPSDGEFEKRASACLLPPVLQYIENLRPKQGSQYVLVNALAAGEYFGCFPAGTLVETEHGEQNIEEVEPGTLVRTHLNRHRKVLARIPKQAEELCDLYVQGFPSNLPALTATPNHELWVIHRQDFVQTKRRVVWKGDTNVPVEQRREQALREMDFSWVPISGLQSGDYIAEPFPLEEDPAALGDEKWNCPEVAFLMGLYAAEGCTVSRAERPGEDHYVVYVTSSAEEPVVQRAAQHAKKFGYLLYTDHSKATSVRAELHWQDFARLCHAHVGKLGPRRKLSAELLRMPRAWQKVFLAAYAAGDGCVRKSDKEEGAQRMVSASAALLRGMRLLLARQGLVGSISGRHNKKASWYNGNPIYELSVSGGQLKGRGTPKSYLHPDGYILSAVKRVEQYDWEGEVFDLTVEEDSSFVASGIVVHNSNINGDYFPEAGLIHAPEGWTGNPTVDKALSKDWGYGFPSFYNAHAYAHHRNKDPSRAYGEVELSVWNDQMKRVELVVRVDYDKCVKFGGVPVWDKLVKGMFPDVSMGCLPSGSLITMADGTQKPIELVRETEWVLTHTGTHRRVTDTMKRHHPGSVFRFSVYGFRRELVVTGNHPLWLVDGAQLQCSPHPKTVNNGRKQRHCTPFVKASSKGCSGCGTVPTYVFEWRRADAAQVGDYLAFPVPMLSTDGVLSGDRSLARLLGYYLAEGHVSDYNSQPREQVNFSLNYEERELAEEIEQLARSLGVDVLWHHEKPEAGARTVSIVSRRLAELCSRHCGDGAKTKVLSKEVLHEDPEVLLELLGAYLNGDGGTHMGSAYFSTSSEQLSHQLFVALARCGLVASVNKNEHKPSEKSVVKKETTEYQVWVGPDFSWKLEPYISKPIRKSLKVRGQRFFYENDGVTYLMAPILEIDEAPHDADVFNFSVDGDESYVAEGLAVHNSKVPYDTSSITLDWELYREAQGTFDPKRHRHPGYAVLEFHKKLKSKNGVGIPGVSITRDDYDEYCQKHMNRILSDGRKVFVYNDYPRFFDISFVFIGADRTAKTMVYIHKSPGVTPSVKIASALSYEDLERRVDSFMEKGASAPEETFVDALVKGAEQKRAEIEKQVVPSQMASKAVPVLTRTETDLPEDVLKMMAAKPMDEALSTAGGLCIVIKPREFQRISLIRMGRKPLADELDSKNILFPKTDEEDESLDLSPDKFLPELGKVLSKFFHMRSATSPAIERRVVIAFSPEMGKVPASSHPSELLRKIGSAYNSYRSQLLEMAPHVQDLIEKTGSRLDQEMKKVASAAPEETFTDLSYLYLRDAYLDELPVGAGTGVMVQPL